MKIFCTASSDTYVTNKIIDTNTRAIDANVGRASVLDLFKLYGETTILLDEKTDPSEFSLDTTGDGTADTAVELSRIFIKFDLKKVHELTGSKINLNSSNFNAKLKLFDVRSGHAVPSNFTVMAIPLSQAFDEGLGRSVSNYNDIGACNFLTASYSNSADNIWFASGANSSGSLGTAGVDLVETADFNDGNGIQRLVFEKTLTEGTEDLILDVTTFVSAAVAGQIANHGFRLSFTGSEENDKKSRFIKRFASRHVANKMIRPRVEVSFDDTIFDHHRSFLFDTSGSLFFNSYGRTGATNLLSGTSGVLSEITGENCLKLKLEKGMFTFIAPASQHKAGTSVKSDNFVSGVYSASFSIHSQESRLVNETTSLAKFISDNKSVTFKSYWLSNDESVAFHTGTVEVGSPFRSSGNFLSNEPIVHALNAEHEYDKKDEVRIRVFGRNIAKENSAPVKSPYSLKSEIFDEVYYRIKDLDSGTVVVDFGENDNSTRLSTDAEGMFFDFHADVLPVGRTYTLDYLIVDRGVRKIVNDKNVAFRVR